MRVTRDPVGPGQESVWDYPRPAVAEPTATHLRVEFGGRIVAETRRGMRTLETSHPPSYYFPPDDVARDLLRVEGGRASLCEWKGQARYFDVVVGERIASRAAWVYDKPTDAFAALAGWFAFYPGRVDACFVDGERVIPQAGDFYGGWITGSLAGPFKGPAGTRFW